MWRSLLVITLAVIGLQEASPSQSVLLRNANVIDGISREPLRGAAVLIVDGRIANVQAVASDVPAGALEIDLAGGWVLPGLIDDHTHVNSRAAARAAVAAGVTTIRTMHVSRYVDVDLRELHRSGQADVPSVLAGGYQLRPDMFDEFYADHPALVDMKLAPRGPEQVRRLVRANLARGVDHIKILATERAGTPETDPRRRTWTDEELAAIVDEAGKGDRHVVAHAHGDEGAAAAIRAGVREIHHGTYMSEATVRLLKASGACLVSTRAVYDTLPADLAKENPALWKRHEELKREASDLIGRAWRAGVRPVAASDGDYERHPQLTVVSEIEALVAAGVPVMEALMAGTSRAAECMGISELTGALRPGLEADLIAIVGNPLEDVGRLRQPKLVLNNGRVVFNTFRSAGPTATVLRR